MTVLSIYPKALENMTPLKGKSGYAWATSVYFAYIQNKQADLKDRLARFSSIASQGHTLSPSLMRVFQRQQAMGVASMASDIASKGLLLSEKSQATAEEEKSQVTAEEAESNTGLYVALGLGITAIAGASYYAVQKKKGKL